MAELKPRSYMIGHEVKQIRGDGGSLILVVTDDEIDVGDTFELHLDASSFGGKIEFYPRVTVISAGLGGDRVLLSEG